MENSVDKNEAFEYERENKVIEFIRKNILNFLITIVVLAFLFKDLIEIEKSGKTIVEIVANSVVNLVVGQLIKNLFLSKGTYAGFNSKAYKRKQKRYSDELEKTDENVNELDAYCEYKNEQRLAKVQKHILRPGRIRYEDFISKRKEEVCRDKTQYKIWEKAEKVKIQILTPENLVSETDSNYEKGKKEESLKSHHAKEGSKSFIIAALLSLIFGYFVPVLNNDIWAGMLWNVIQVAIWLAFGIIQYYQEYTYITTDYAQRLLRKTTYLVEFNSGKGEWKKNEKDNIKNNDTLQPQQGDTNNSETNSNTNSPSQC